MGLPLPPPRRGWRLPARRALTPPAKSDKTVAELANRGLPGKGKAKAFIGLQH
jgi:hypothetical protein